MKKGFTLIELLVVVAIIGIVAALILGALGKGTHGKEQVFNAQVKDKYPVVEDGNTIFRVEVEQPGTNLVETLENQDDFWYSKRNSATVQANLKIGQWYKFTTRGIRNENWSIFPNIIDAVPVESPVSVDAEPESILDKDTGDIDL